jgi:hypothetical protein
MVVSDVTGGGTVSSLDAALVLQAVEGLSPSEIPDLPREASPKQVPVGGEDGNISAAVDPPPQTEDEDNEVVQKARRRPARNFASREYAYRTIQTERVRASSAHLRTSAMQYRRSMIQRSSWRVAGRHSMLLFKRLRLSEYLREMGRGVL